MNDKVVLVTPPDDIQIDGIRILTVNLIPEQTQIISDSLNSIAVGHSMIIYLWKNGEDLDWLFDKKHKSHLIIFNADDFNESLTGYFAAQKKSAYFGNLKNLHKVNTSAIYSVEDCVSLLNLIIDQYE